MLTRSVALASAAVAAAAILAVAATGLSAAQAGPPSPSPTGEINVCPPTQSLDPITGTCMGSIVVTSSAPSSSAPSGSKGGGTQPTCTKPPPEDDIPVPCEDPDEGWYDRSTYCYFKVALPQPPAGDPSWEGHQPGDGAVYNVTCFVAPYVGSPTVLKPGAMKWLPKPPGGGPAPADVALMAMTELIMHGPTNGIAPPLGKPAIVGIPIWLWTDDTPEPTQWGDELTHWGPIQKTITAGGITVTVTAQARQIEWHMGDGHTLVCGKGTPYKPGMAATTVRDCSYTYATTSAGQPNQQFQVYGITTWDITWTGGGQSGKVTMTPQSQPIPVRVESAQAVVVH
ncbi:MAG: hypothetical protein JF587_13715 [Catenulisporales bacterium]|nr:hypothetical protein [Catenulisporales bacterium]